MPTIDPTVPQSVLNAVIAKAMADTAYNAATAERLRSYPEAVLLQRRINATLAYLDQVALPNAYTVLHVRAMLSGQRDAMLDHFTGS